MSINKIMCCCGSGLGSSMLVRMNVEKILKENNYLDIDVEHSSISDAQQGAADLFVIGKDLESSLMHIENKIVLENIMDINELKEKLLEVLPSRSV